MLKRLSSFTLIFILMVSTTGVNISIQWCGDEWTGVKVNGFHILTEAGKAVTARLSTTTVHPVMMMRTFRSGA